MIVSVCVCERENRGMWQSWQCVLLEVSTKEDQEIRENSILSSSEDRVPDD